MIKQDITSQKTKLILELYNKTEKDYYTNEKVDYDYIGRDYCIDQDDYFNRFDSFNKNNFLNIFCWRIIWEPTNDKC